MVQTTSHIFSGKVDIESNLLVGSSHLFVDTLNNRVGITTTDPDASLHVNGNAYVESNVGVGSNIVLDGDTGIITATEFRGDGSNLSGVLTSLQNATDQGSTSNATIQLTNADTSLVASGNVVISGNVTSLTFIGDGSQLTGIATNFQSITDNGNVTSNTVQFTNTGTSLTASGTIEAAAVQVNGLDVALDQDMSSNAARVAALETDLASNVTRVTNLEAANTVQESLINNLRTDVTSNTSRISSLEADRTSNTVRISLLESANIVQESLINNHTGRISDLEAANTVQGGLITTVETDLADNASRIYTLETTVPSNTSITELQAANTVQASLISSLESANTVQGGLITALETGLADNVTRIETLETANTVQASLISSLESANTVQGGLITALETATQHISATASGTVISSNLDVTGNIFMRGNTFIVESETKLINDAIIGIANNNTTSTTDVGILMQRPTANVALIHHGGTNDFTIGYTQNDLEATDITNDTTNEINVNVLGNLYTQNNLTVGNVVTASTFVGDGTGITGITLQQVATVGHTTTTPLITSNTLIGKRTGAFDSKGDSTTEGEVFMDNLNAGEMTAQSISGSQDGSGITLTNPIVITYYVSNWLVNGQSWNDVFHFTFIEGLTYVFDISHISNRVQTSGPHIGNFWISGDENWGYTSIPYDQGVHIVGTQGYSGAQFRWTVPRGASSFQGRTAGSHPGPGYFWFMTKPITSGSTFPGNVTERRIRVIANPDQHILTGQTQIHGNLYSDSTIVSTNVEATDTVSSTRALISNVATMGTTKTFVVTVSNATGANKYYIDGELQATIELHEHQTYIFDLSSGTLSGHPFVFDTSNSNDGTTSSNPYYTTGITSTGTYASDEQRTFVVPAGAPTTLYYYCTAHSGMGGQISISPTAELVVSGRIVASGNVEASKFIGDGSQLTGVVTSISLQNATDAGNTTSNTTQFTNAATSLTASGNVVVSGNVTADHFVGDGSNVNIGAMTVTNIPYVDANKQLRDSHIKNAPDATIIASNLQVTGNIFVSGNSYSITSENTVINDRIIGLANNNTSTTLDTGLMLQYPQKNVAIIHHGTVSGSPHSGQLTVGYTQNTFVEDNVIHDANNITLNVIGHVITQNNITVGAQGSYYGDGTTLTGVALSADLTNNVTRIQNLETATIISNSSTITTGFTRGDIIYASADNVLNKLALGTSGQVLKSDGTDVVWGTGGGGGGGGSSPWQTNGNKIYYSTDNVGIGVTDPAFKLDVHGTANVGALTATSLSVGGQTLALATDLAANASRINTLYTEIRDGATAGDIIYASGTNTLAKLGIGSQGQVLTVQSGLPAWVNATGGGGGGGGTSQWTTVNTNEIHYNGNVGIANSDPGHDLSVGSNLYVDDDGSNVLVVTGNTAMSTLTLGQVSIVASYGLSDILNTSNTSSNIMQLTDATTGLVATGNVHALAYHGDGTFLTGLNLEHVANEGNATSNTVRFTNTTTGLVTTANVEVGGELTVSGNTETKNINMLQTANTAAIKLNSNVVTEFSRSKKLIKYPRVLMTSNSSGGYVAGRSTVYLNSANLEAWKMFDGEASTYWHSENSTGYWLTSGAYDGSSQLITGHLGEWVTLQLPTNEKVQLHGIRVFPRGLRGQNSGWSAGAAPKDVVVVGSDDGSSWNVIATTTLTNYSFGTNPSTSTPVGEEYVPATFDFEATEYYQYVGLIIKSLYSGNHTHAAISNLEFLGTPEYDPETHGTNVNFKTEMNTPTTDGLNLYYDAKNFVSGSVTVQDETSNNRDAEMNATFDNGQIKAFDFSGAYTSNVTTSDHGLGTGDVQFSLAMWLYRKSKSGGATHDYVVHIGNGGTVYQSILVWILYDQINFDAWGAAVRYDEIIRNDTWYHFVLTHNGGTVPSSANTVMYVNGRPVKPSAPYGEATRWIATSTINNNPFNLQGSKLTLGSEHNGTTEYFNGKIANFRLYNRVINPEEAIHLYNFQKEEFGHGVNTLTLKDGCLGIGTDKPRAALDYHGERRVYGMEIPTFSVTKNNDTSTYMVSAGNYIYFNHANVNRGGHYTFDDGRFTAPLVGCYQFSFFGMSNSNITVGIEIRKNGESLSYTDSTGSTSNGCWPYSQATGAGHNQVCGTCIMFLHPGDYVQVFVQTGNIYVGHNGHNQFSGFYIG